MIHASTRAMEKAVSAMRVLLEAIDRCHGEPARDIEAGLRSISARQDEVAQQIAYLRSELESICSYENDEDEDDDEDEEDDDDDDDGYDGGDQLREELRALEAERALLMGHIYRGRKLLQKVISAEAKLAKITSAGIPEAMAFIRSKRSALLNLQNLRLDAGPAGIPAGTIGTAAGSVAAPASDAATGRSKAPSAVSLLSIRLPEGFTWIPVGRICESGGISKDQLHFNKASEDKFAELVMRFKDELLPELRRCKDPAALRDELERQDLEMGRFGADAVANVYDLFFGSESIRVEKGRPEFDNGRHRSWTAVQLGWSHLPGQYS